MKIRHRIDPTRLLENNYMRRLHELADEWSDQTAEVALAGNPRRAFYLTSLAEDLPAIANSQRQRG